MKNKTKPKVVYKYACDDGYTYDNIKNCVLYLSPASTLNDDFEVQPFVDLDSVWNWLQNTNLSEVDLSSYGEDTSNIIENLEKVKYLGIDEFWNFFLLFLEELKQLYKITSLSENGESPVMWGSYAGKNTGVMIEYDIETFESSGLLIREVEYQEEKVDLTDIFFSAISGDLAKQTSINSTITQKFMDCIFRKFKDWSYEQEVRIVSTDKKICL